jgi:uncharacterized membrane protein
MVPLSVLIIGFVLFRIAGRLGVKALDGWQPALRDALAIMFLVTASAHWGRGRADLIAMVPPLIPRPDLMVTITGVFEILGAIGLLVPRASRAAAIGLILLLLAVFPANVYAALNDLQLLGKPVTPLAERTAMQIAFLAVVGATLWRKREASRSAVAAATALVSDTRAAALPPHY